MKLEIDTTRKTVTILEEASILEVLNFLKFLEKEDYKIVSKHTISIKKETTPVPVNPYIPYPNVPWIEPIYPSYPIWVYDPNSQPYYQPSTC